MNVVIMVSCVEPFETTFVDFDSALVIEATITNETKPQLVFLTRTFEFEADGASPETSASVTIVDSDGDSYDFEHVGQGVYQSIEAFAAKPGLEYRLSVTTRDGRQYGSDATRLTPVTEIDEINVERITNDDGEDGIAILVNSFDPTGNSKNYRYEYEETYRVIAPSWSPIALIGDPAGGCGVLKIVNTEFEKVCYPTRVSNEIILTSTNNLDEDRVENFMVRFINRNNYIMSHRYSILVRQYVQSDAAQVYFETLADFSENESVLSETQPGFLQGNVFSVQDEAERVLGFFNVSSVSVRRIFFNYDDFYPGEDLPPYLEPCRPSAPPISKTGRCVLRPILEIGVGIYFMDNSPTELLQGPYLIVSRVCGDCSVLGPKEVPDFWIE